MTTKTEKALKEHFGKRRIDGKILGSIVAGTCESYDLGRLVRYSRIPYGYQVVNLRIETNKGKFFLKVFPGYSFSQTQHYIELMQKVADSGISYPGLVFDRSGKASRISTDYGLMNICVQTYVNGKNFFEMREDPDLAEVRDISRQAALINSIDYIPEYHELDTWATRFFVEQYREKSSVLTPDEKDLVDPVLFRFREIDLNSLPKSFTHGDMGHTNVMKDNNGKIWIIDFGVAAYQPRIIELAVLFHDLFLDPRSVDLTKRKRIIALEEYQKSVGLTAEELRLLPLLTKATSSMYLMSTAYMMRKFKDGSKEIKFWYERSRASLERF